MDKELFELDRTNTNPAYWENFLSGEGLGDIDHHEGFSLETQIDFAKSRSKDILDLDIDLETYISNIQNKYDIRVDLNVKEGKISLYSSKSNDLVGEVYLYRYIDGDFRRDIHLYNVVEEKYRGMGFGKVMFELYIKLSESYPSFILPEEEYTNIVSMINLYRNYGYVPKYKIINGTNYPIELDENDFLEMESIISDYKEGYKERRLGYTVILEKDNFD